MKDKLTASMPRHFPEEMAEAKTLNVKLLCLLCQIVHFSLSVLKRPEGETLCIISSIK
jgi:hypothetical protein